jgi:hypothetical protein
MAPGIECRVMQNHPGRGWYWEVIADSTTVVARGLADTTAEAVSQATSAMRRALVGVHASAPLADMTPAAIAAPGGQLFTTAAPPPLHSAAARTRPAGHARG